ncbi:MAG: precorrin-2 C(20)-methyltransferase [Oscillospiraceae bacterium]|jgi:precorrin-2/cobalt-factor-2 C20-methyltransferase
MNKGKLYGVGVGPGDPELLTLKAIRILRGCAVIAVPHRDKDQCFALRIALGAVPELAEKPLLEVDMPMTKDEDLREQAYRAGVELLRAELDAGRDVAFLTLGDPTIYSTYCYLHERILALGYDAEIVPGVPSFCASAAALNIPLCENSQELHILPGTYSPTESLSYPGVKVFMKNDLPATLAAAREQKLSARMVENCGTAQQQLYRSIDEIPENAGYYSLLIIKEDGQ